MNRIKPSWDFMSDENRKGVLEALMRFYKSEFDEDIGMIKCDILLDKFLELTAIDIYNGVLFCSVNIY